MKDIKFRYILRNHETGDTSTMLATIETLESVGSGIPNTYGIVERNLFTGLKDRNGVDICEGDIVRYDTSGYESHPVSRTYVITWHSRLMAFGLGDEPLDEEPALMNSLDYGSDCDVYEVVGNVYENPDLLPYYPQ